MVKRIIWARSYFIFLRCVLDKLPLLVCLLFLFIDKVESNTLDATKPPRDTANSELSEFSDSERQQLLIHARSMCNVRQSIPDFSSSKLFREDVPVIVTLFSRKGVARLKKRIDGSGSIVFKIKTAVDLLCHSTLVEKPDGYTIHIMLVTRTVRLPNFGFKGLFTNKVFEPQVMGVAFEYKGRRVERDPLESVSFNHGPKSLRRAMMDKLGLEPLQFGQLHNLSIEFYEVDHFGEGIDGDYVRYFRGFEYLYPDDITTSLVESRLKMIGEWYRNNVRDDGQVVYKYHPFKDTENDSDRTMVRSTMAVWILNRLAVYLDDKELLELGNQGIEYYLNNYFNINVSRQRGEVIPSETPLENGNEVKNRYTAASFIAGALMERPDWHLRKRDIELLMDYAMSKKKPNGILWTQFGISQYFMPGQLLLMVSYAEEKLGSSRYEKYFENTYSVYRSALENQLALAPPLWTPYAPAWYTQPLVHRYARVSDSSKSDLIFDINDRLIDQYYFNSAYQKHYDYDGSMTPKRGYYGNTSVTAATLESLVDTAIHAKRINDEERLMQLKKVIPSIVAHVLRMQFTPNNTYWVKNQKRVTGGLKTNLINQEIWMDNVWHLTSALIKLQRNRLLD